MLYCVSSYLFLPFFPFASVFIAINIPFTRSFNSNSYLISLHFISTFAPLFFSLLSYRCPIVVLSLSHRCPIYNKTTIR